MNFSKTEKYLPPVFVVGLAAILLFLVPYSGGYGADRIPLFEWIYLASRDYGDWEHCVLVPLLCVGLLWFQRHVYFSKEWTICQSGWFVLGLGCLFYWFGYLADVRYIGFFSWQLVLAGLIILLLGKKAFRRLFFCWFFLIFMWPLIFLDSMLAFPLRVFMSSASYHFLDIIGLDVLRVGTAVVSAPQPDLGLAQGERFAVDIADPCSGIRSLFALMMVSALYGFFTLPEEKTFPVMRKKYQVVEYACIITDQWKRWVLLALSLPLAVAGNFFRVMMLTFGTMWFGSEFAIGKGLEDPSTFHMVAGFFVFIVALAGMVAVTVVLDKGLKHYLMVFKKYIRRIQKNGADR